MARFVILLGTASWLWLLGVPSIAVAQNSAIESAQKALDDTRQPWYDAESDGLKEIVVADEQQEERADWRGVDRPEWYWKWNWSFSWLGEIFKFVAWTVLIALIAMLIYALVQAFLKIEPTSLGVSRDLSDDGTALTDEQRIENLPIQLQKKKGDFLQIAREAYEAGNFADAIVYLFSYRLLQLDRAGFIRLTKGKTNRQYLVELRRTSDLENIFAQTMVSFEDVFFGKHPLTRDRFEGCWNHNEQFNVLVSEVRS